jgi:DNA-binding response OmpR family regulator
MRTLLIVEDDDAIRGSLAEGLGMAGYRVIAVPTSTEALSELKSDRPIDFAIIGIQMPPRVRVGARWHAFIDPTCLWF